MNESTIRQKIRDGINATLVIGNPQSMHHTEDKIIDVIYELLVSLGITP